MELKADSKKRARHATPMRSQGHGQLSHCADSLRQARWRIEKISLPAQQDIHRQRAGAADRYCQGHEHQRHRVLDTAPFSRCRGKKKAMLPVAQIVANAINTARPKATGRTKKPSAMHTTVDSSMTNAKTPIGTGMPYLSRQLVTCAFGPLPPCQPNACCVPCIKNVTAKPNRRKRNAYVSCV